MGLDQLSNMECGKKLVMTATNEPVEKALLQRDSFPISSDFFSVSI
jgi:hypothetical protein